MNYKIGVCQFKPTLLDKKANLEAMKKMVDGVEADMIVFPELATSGYVFSNKDEVYSVADRFEGSDTTNKFTELSRKNNTAYVIGFPECADGKLYNSSMLINPDGTKYLYRKIHLFNEEKLWFETGNLGFTVAKSKHNIQIGLMICFDWIFPESARTLMLKGAQIIAHCANLVLPWCQQAMLTRSLENRVFSITCNRTGTETNPNSAPPAPSGDNSVVPHAKAGGGGGGFHFTGMSQAVSPTGEILFRLDETEETCRIIEIDTDRAEEKHITPYNHIITDRKIEYYSQK